jgi:hypothetical protein
LVSKAEAKQFGQIKLEISRVGQGQDFRVDWVEVPKGTHVQGCLMRKGVYAVVEEVVRHMTPRIRNVTAGSSSSIKPAFQVGRRAGLRRTHGAGHEIDESGMPAHLGQAWERHLTEPQELDRIHLVASLQP